MQSSSWMWIPVLVYALAAVGCVTKTRTYPDVRIPYVGQDAQSAIDYLEINTANVSTYSIWEIREGEIHFPRSAGVFSEYWMIVAACRAGDGYSPKVSTIMLDRTVIGVYEGDATSTSVGRKFVRELCYGNRTIQSAEPGATDNPDAAQRLREDH